MNFCEYGCGKEANHQFKNGKWCCSGNLSSCPKIKEKRQQTFIEKYGVDNPSKSKEVIEKKSQTWLRKYGVKNPAQSKEIQEKMKQTNLEKYGVDNPAQNNKVQEKMKQTNLKIRGVEYPLQNKEVQEKRKQTLVKNYGVDNPRKSKEIQRKIKQINLKNHGVEYYVQSIEAKEKFLKRHPFFCQIEEIKIEDNQFKVHCKNSNCQNSKENGGWFTPTSIQISNRIGTLENETGNDGSFFYCSQKCKDTCPAYNVRGDPNRDTQLPYTQEQYETFRLEVLTRDNYTCQFCGEPATHVHHERPVKLEPFFSLDPDFGWACCEKCHYEKGHPKGTDCSTGNLAAKVCRPIKKKETTSQ